MGFWISLIYFGFKLTLMASLANVVSVIIFSLLTSLAASIEYALIRRI